VHWGSTLFIEDRVVTVGDNGDQLVRVQIARFDTLFGVIAKPGIEYVVRDDGCGMVCRAIAPVQQFKGDGKMRYRIGGAVAVPATGTRRKVNGEDGREFWFHHEISIIAEFQVGVAPADIVCKDMRRAGHIPTEFFHQCRGVPGDLSPAKTTL